MGYDVTNNSSVVELVQPQSVPVGNDLTPITLPDVVPPPQPLVSESVVPVGATIQLPKTLPTVELIGMDTITPRGDVITIPNFVPPDGVVLLESIRIPDFLRDGNIEVGVKRLEDLEDVDIAGRTDGNIIVYVQATNSYQHVAPTGTGFDLHYIHNQGMAAQVWNIAHNLGKRPAIHIEDMSGNEMIPQIIHIDNNNAQAVFGNATFSGTAYCN
jgi:hypothetical protein